MESPAVDARKAKGRRRKEKKIAIEISLYINGIKYEFGVMCTFCAKKQAVCHCPECTDFYCAGCDLTAHNTKKRKNHVRSSLSDLDMDRAAGYITRAIRRYGIIRMLQSRCRSVFKRYFDRKSLNYYYVNTITQSRSWRKPFFLRKQELFPYMTPFYAACKCQNLYHMWVARDKSRTAISAQYAKIFDRLRGRFYYAFNGPSLLLPRASWKKPRLLGKRSFPKDLIPIYTVSTVYIKQVLIRHLFRCMIFCSVTVTPIESVYHHHHHHHC
jgi:hypothetical protein